MRRLPGVYIIAEAGVNHNGSVDMAKQLVDEAAAAGADAIKFQTFKSEMLVSSDAPKAEYQQKTTGSKETQYEMLKKLELGEEGHKILYDHCLNRGIHFLSTPFDIVSLNLLTGLFSLPLIKIPSGEITNALLLLKAAYTGKPVILSTGMSTLAEIEMALSILAFGYTGSTARPSLLAFQDAFCLAAGQEALNEKVMLLHCTSEYPAPYDEVNLKAMDVLREAFRLSVGYSDHTSGIAVAIAAVARGAVVIEKHFTLDRSLKGPDHKASLEPKELQELVQSIRQVELALGLGPKLPTPTERKNRVIARKSLVAACSIRKGEIFTEENLTVKRPADGVSSLSYWDWLGKTAERDYERDERVSP